MFMVLNVLFVNKTEKKKTPAFPKVPTRPEFQAKVFLTEDILGDCVGSRASFLAELTLGWFWSCWSLGAPFRLPRPWGVVEGQAQVPSFFGAGA